MRTPILAIALAAFGGPVLGATWTVATSEMTRTGSCGSGSIVLTDGCNPVAYTGQAQIAAYGQGLDDGWNSQDADAAEWRIRGLDDAKAVRLTFMDLHDQPRSFARVTIGGAEWNFDRGDNANLRFIDLGLPGGDDILVTIHTRLNDGFSARADVCRADPS